MRRFVMGVGIACAFATVLLLPSSASAQQRASFVGVVQDSSGAIMPGVAVEASLFNVPNYATILTVNETVGPLYFNPQAITAGRRAQVGAQIDW